MTARPVLHTDPEVGIPDLIRRLGDDSKRLVSDEVQLAKLEISASVREGARGATWMAVAFGAGVVAAVALTVGLATLIGRIDNRHYWAGAIIVGLGELALAVLLVKRGVSAFARPSYTLAESREEIATTARWAATAGPSGGKVAPAR